MNDKNTLSFSRSQKKSFALLNVLKYKRVYTNY